MKKQFCTGVVVLAGRIEPHADIGTRNRFYLLPVPWTHLDLTRAIHYVADLNYCQQVRIEHYIEIFDLLQNNPAWQQALASGPGLRAWPVLGQESWPLLEILDRGWKGTKHYKKAIALLDTLSGQVPTITLPFPDKRTFIEECRKQFQSQLDVLLQEHTEGNGRFRVVTTLVVDEEDIVNACTFLNWRFGGEFTQEFILNALRQGFGHSARAGECVSLMPDLWAVLEPAEIDVFEDEEDIVDLEYDIYRKERFERLQAYLLIRPLARLTRRKFKPISISRSHDSPSGKLIRVAPHEHTQRTP